MESFRGGKTKLQGFFVGQLMKKTQGKADPKLANQILIKKLKAKFEFKKALTNHRDKLVPIKGLFHYNFSI